MTIPSLANLPLFPYIDKNGLVLAEFRAEVGVYAIFNAEQLLQFVGYSRDIYLSLKQHLVRQPQQCYGVKVLFTERPSRALLEEIRQQWIIENAVTPPGNGDNQALWTEPIDAKQTMTEKEKADFENADGVGQIKLLKTIARRVEADIQTQLQARGIQEQIRFNPKLKEQGLLDLKS